MKSQLEQAVADRFGEIGIREAAAIQSAVRHEMRALLLQRWLRSESPQPIAIMDRLKILDAIGAATDSRDRCIERLGLSGFRPGSPQAAQSDPWAALDAEPDPEAIPTPQRSPSGQPDASPNEVAP